MGDLLPPILEVNTVHILIVKVNMDPGEES